MIDNMLCSMLRRLPVMLACPLYSRCVRPFAPKFPKPYEAASLKFCPAMRMRLNPTDTAHGHIAFTGIYEPDLTRLVAQIATEKGGRMLDVGANFGYYSLLWCGLSIKNTAAAFEASPLVAPALRHNLSLNHLESRVKVTELAVSDAEGELNFDVGSEEQTGWGGISKCIESKSLVRVRTQRLDLLAGDEDYTLLKIDCEGADFLVLNGAQKLISEHRVKHVCFEENQPRMQELGIRPGMARELLLSYGYRCEPLGDSLNPTEFHAWVD